MRMIIVLWLLSLGGCSWIESDAGKADYSYTITMPDGTVHHVRLKNAKDVGLVSASMKYKDVEVELLEQGVSSSGPMAVMAEANAKMVDVILGSVP